MLGQAAMRLAAARPDVPAYRWYILEAAESIGGVDLVAILELKYRVAGVWAPVGMVSYTSPAPYVISSSSEAGDTWAAWMAFSGTISNWWSTGFIPPLWWIAVDFGDPVKVTGVHMRKYDSSKYGPRSWRLYGSNVSATAGREQLIAVDNHVDLTWSATLPGG